MRLMYFPAFIGELLWSGATLKSLGATISVVMELELSVSVIVSALIALFYTFFGGLWSVAFTDVAQLICMFIGMVSVLTSSNLKESFGIPKCVPVGPKLKILQLFLRKR